MKRASFEWEAAREVHQQMAERNAFVQHEHAEPGRRPARLRQRSRRVTPQGDLTVGAVTVPENRGYPGRYSAAAAKRTGLPMWEKTYGAAGSGYRDRRSGETLPRYRGASRTERTRKGRPVEAGEAVIGWLRVQHGYVPLYEAENRKEIPQ